MRIKMKKQTNQRRQLLLPAAITTILMLGAFAAAFAQGKAGNGIGADYGARDPLTCQDMKKPLKGAPSAEQAKQYVICGLEHVTGSNTLYLVEDVTVVVGGAIPYNPNNFPFASDINTKSPVYPIRASFNQYQCGRMYKDPSHPLYNVGKNCTEYGIPKSTGVCVKTTFGDWRCDITSRDDDPKPPKRGIPPPPPVADDSKPATSRKPDASKTEVSQKPNTSKPAVVQNQEDSEYPKPDTTEMEKWYDVVKYEYDIIAGRLFFVVKPKKDSRPSGWLINFYDADGVQVIGENLVVGTSIFTPVGQAEKAYAYTPSEKAMKTVKKVVITRHIL